MSDKIEVEGKTVDEAIEKACAEFGVPREKLSIDILSEGSTGFLGLGAKKAKIQASLLTLSIHEEIRFETPKEERMESPAEKAKEAKDSRESQPVQHRPEKRDRDRKPQNAPSPAMEAVKSTPASVAATASGQDEGIGLKAKELLEGLLERMSIPSPVSVEETEEAVILNIQGDGEGLLIGKRGQNLDALQHIVNKAVNKPSNGKKMIIVDTEAYRKRREESLVTLAERLGQKVKKTRKTVTVSNMNAHDRRIIHMTLQGDTALLTKSRGEGEYRKIIIMPAKRERESGQSRHSNSNQQTKTAD